MFQEVQRILTNGADPLISASFQCEEYNAIAISAEYQHTEIFRYLWHFIHHQVGLDNLFFACNVGAVDVVASIFDDIVGDNINPENIFRFQASWVRKLFVHK